MDYAQDEWKKKAQFNHRHRVLFLLGEKNIFKLPLKSLCSIIKADYNTWKVFCKLFPENDNSILDFFFFVRKFQNFIRPFLYNINETQRIERNNTQDMKER